MQQPVTLVRPGAQSVDSRGPASSLPSDLLDQSVARLRILAVVYAATFFLAAIFPMLLIPADRALLFSSFMQWGPSVIAITVALVVAALVGSPRITPALAMKVGLAFEVAGSYGIAAAEFTDPAIYHAEVRMLGLSWVAVWTMLFTTVVPTTPPRAVAAALASVSAVPVIIGLMIVVGHTEFRPEPLQFFFWLVFPYLLVVGMAYVGARVIHGLGTEVKRARELGSYQLEEKLGQGGMGEVWRARHRLLARPAAIKLIRPAQAVDGRPGTSDDLIRRFEREAQVTARLRSPHTVELFDFGVSADGAFYYVMELLDGLDTHSLVQRFGPQPFERTIYLLRQVCHSLSEAQACGLVHRDIKPANIFLCRYGEEYDFVKVLDFGIVKRTTENPGGDQTVTQETAVQGTPAFIAPEQAVGAPLDGRADIYATGCLAYWLLTGQYVFTADTPLGLLFKHAQTSPTPPSARLDVPIPAALDRLVLECLAKDPSGRPQSARELSSRLARVEGAEGWSQDRARAWWRRICRATGLSGRPRTAPTASRSRSPATARWSCDPSRCRDARPSRRTHRGERRSRSTMPRCGPWRSSCRRGMDRSIPSSGR
jgi:eukaryotic-like serine/threonine-protein kinase